MDEVFNQHSSATRHKNRSSTNLNHLTLAPITSKLPLIDHDILPDPLSAPPLTISYLEGKSAPTTPRLLSRSPAPPFHRSSSHARGASTPTAGFPKSKSTTYLNINHLGCVSPNANHPSNRRRRSRGFGAEDFLSGKDHHDTDWLLRVGTLISAETRESKGQAWLISRASTTSLAGFRDADEEALERELMREREMASRRGSRRGSNTDVIPDGSDDMVFLPLGRQGTSPMALSPSHSRLGSCSHSRVGMHMLSSPSMEHSARRPVDGYFHRHESVADDEYIAGPDFVNLDEELEANVNFQDASIDDEAQVRRLVQHGHLTSWFGNVLGFRLDAVDENEEGSEHDQGEEEEYADADDDSGTGPDDEVEVASSVQNRRKSCIPHFEGAANSQEEHIPAPKADEGGWRDAAWLLTVASKVLI